MKLTSPHSPARVEPLPVELSEMSPELIEIDAQLSEIAARSAVPIGLSDRAFAASVAWLPERRLRLTSHQASRTVQQAWIRSVSGKFAMAASLALAFGLALWMVMGSQESSLALADTQAEYALAHALQPVDSRSAGYEGQIDYLLETSELTGPEDITSELAMLVRELEM